jgi:hypothetical protein
MHANKNQNYPHGVLAKIFQNARQLSTSTTMFLKILKLEITNFVFYIFRTKNYNYINDT